MLKPQEAQKTREETAQKTQEAQKTTASTQSCAVSEHAWGLGDYALVGVATPTAFAACYYVKRSLVRAMLA
jgi:hypothetical protein